MTLPKHIQIKTKPWQLLFLTVDVNYSLYSSIINDSSQHCSLHREFRSWV